MLMNLLKSVSKTLWLLAKLNQLVDFAKLLHNKFKCVLSVWFYIQTGVS